MTIQSVPNPFPNLPATINKYEWWAAEEWYNNLTYSQRDYLLLIETFSESFVILPAEILTCYRKRAQIEAMADWPTHPLKSSPTTA